MEKNRIRPIVNGKSFRMSYSRQKEVLEMPNLIEVQKDSYQWFLNDGLKEVFDDISPIEDTIPQSWVTFFLENFKGIILRLERNFPAHLTVKFAKFGDLTFTVSEETLAKVT